MKCRVIICEASEIIHEGVCAFLNGQGYTVVTRTVNPERLSERIRGLDADMLFLNPALLGHAEKDLPIQLSKKFPNLCLIALVSNYVENSILKPYHAVIGINDSRQKVLGKLAEIVNQANISEKDEEAFDLSKREKEVLAAIAKGLTNKEIGDIMSISVNTVITHRKNITTKTGIKSVSGLTVYALLNNLVDETEIYK